MTAPLRIGLIIDSLEQPRWVRRCLEKVVGSSAGKLELVFKVGHKKDYSSFLFHLYNRVDRKLYAADAVSAVSVEDLLAGVTVAEEFEQIKAANLDVLINFGPSDLNSKLAWVARHGVWFYSFGPGHGFDELAHH